MGNSMKLLGFILTFSVALSTSQAFSQLKNVWEEIDIRYYFPIEHGLKDLSFTVRKTGLAEQVNKSFHLGKEKDIYVQVYFLFPDRYRMKVFGLPDGFKELRQTIKASISPYLEFVFPVKFQKKYQIYQFKESQQDGMKLLKATDPKYQAAIPEFDMFFDNNDVLQKTVAMSPQGPNETKFSYSKKRWSKNKYVLERVTSETETKLSNNTLTTDVVYVSKDGFGLPKKITITSKSELNERTKNLDQFKGQQTSWSNESVITFDGYEINQKRAQSVFYSGTKQVQ